MEELELLRQLAEKLRYYARHGIIDASQDINEELYGLLQAYEEVRVGKVQNLDDLEVENNGC